MHAAQVRRWLLWVCVLLIAGTCLPPQVGRAEFVPLRLSVRRLNGADLWGRVAGTFSLSVETPEDVRVVTYLVDGQPVGRATSYPFTAQLDTRDFPTGEHELQAVAHFANGAVTTSNTVSLHFRSRNWLLVARQSMFLYAFVLLGLGAVGGLVVHRLMRIRPRLILLSH
jgi:hypothetical protein